MRCDKFGYIHLFFRIHNMNSRWSLIIVNCTEIMFMIMNMFVIKLPLPQADTSDTDYHLPDPVTDSNMFMDPVHE